MRIFSATSSCCAVSVSLALRFCDVSLDFQIPAFEVRTFHRPKVFVDALEGLIVDVLAQ